jgi:post-segregation antitoxin (ccd killing protein)
MARRRITLTLPADSLIQAERIARARHVNLSTVIAEALSDGLRTHSAAERSEEGEATFAIANLGNVLASGMDRGEMPSGSSARSRP